MREMSGKFPYMPMFWRDFLYDRAVFPLTPWAFKLWTYALGAMWEDNRSGRVTGTVQDFMKLSGLDSAAEVEAALDDIALRETGNVIRRNGLVTLENRRMVAEAQARAATKKRVSKHRGGNAPVTPDVTPDVTDTRARSIGDGSSSPTLIPPSPSTTTTTTIARDGFTKYGWPEWLKVALVHGWFKERVKADGVAADMADRFIEWNAYIDRFKHLTEENWEYFAARFLREEVRRNGDPNKRFRSEDVQRQVEQVAEEPRADAAFVAEALAEMRRQTEGGAGGCS
jgi:hypothetical protein